MKKSTKNRAGRTSRERRAAGVVALISAFLGDVGTAHAQTWLYDGTDYGTADNWSTGVTPGAGETATFNAAGANQPIVGGNFTIGMVDMSAGLLTINAASQLTVQTAFNLSGGSIGGDGTLTLNTLLATTGTSAMTIDPVITGAGALTKSGTGMLTLTGANSYTGATTITA